MVAHWEMASSMVELWDSRTLPRLQLFKELHCRLALLPPDELLLGFKEREGRRLSMNT